MVPLTQTQQTLFTAQDALAQDRLLRLQAIVQLYQALGGGWSPPERTPSATPPAAPMIVAPNP
jgi:outer membrane protein TolC